MICGVGEIRGNPPDGQCQGWYRVEYDDIRCQAPPDIVITGGCVHEHVHTFEVCEKCMAAVAAGPGRDWRCGWCYFGDDSHECTIEIINEEWLEKS